MTAITSIAAPITPEDLLNLADAARYELIEGKLVERNMGMESSEIAIRIAILIGMFLREDRLGHLYGADASYQCFPDAPKMVRKPDVSFIRIGRLPGERTPQGHCLISPDLAVEVLSPGDLAYEVEDKVVAYLNAGVPLVWVVNPSTRSVRIRRPRSSSLGTASELASGDIISGDDILPGFSCKVDEFFA